MAGTVADGVGGRLRALRVARELTLERVAGACGLTRGYLSLVERDLKTPSLAALLRLAEALDTEVGSFFAERAEPQPDYVLYRHQAPGRDPVPLAPGRSGKVMEPFFLVPESRPMQLVTHSGEELIVVLRGEVAIHLGAEELVLQANDSLYFNATTQHMIRRVGSAHAEVLVVVSRA